MKCITLVVLLVTICAAYAANIDYTKCGPVCLIYCFHGNVLDSNGCPTCACNTAPTTSSKCASVLCALYCPNGFATDASGCETCACKDSGSLDNLLVS